MKYVSLVLSGLLLIALAGCGGGGDDGKVTMVENELDALMVELEAAKAEAEKAQTQAEADAAAAAAAMAAQTQAEMEAATAKAAEATAKAAQTQAEMEAATAKAAEATAKAAQTQAEMEATAAKAAETTAVLAKVQAEANVTIAKAAEATAKAAQTRAEADLETAKTARATAETARAAAVTARDAAVTAKTAADAAKLRAEADLTVAKGAETAAKALAEQYKKDAADARALLAASQSQLTDAQQQAQQSQTETSTLSQQLEAHTRGRALLEALGDLEADATTSPVFEVPDVAPAATISATGTALKLEAAPLTGGTSSVSGKFKGSKATLARTVPGSGVKQRMVVYTDREVSRTFANHFGKFIVDRTASKLRFDADEAGWWATAKDMLATTAADAIGRTVSNISHGLRKPASSTYASDPGNAATTVPAIAPTTPRKSISARVLGVSGTFVCDNNGTACDIDVDGTYYRSDNTDRALRSKLATLTLAPDGGNLYFQPSNANSSISLRGNLKVGDTTHTDLIDNQYMVFGWWQSIPRDADGMYDVDVFAYDFPDGALLVDANDYAGKAEYEGPAAGVYVEERFVTEEEFGGVRQSIAESGEFTATVNLRADFAADTIEGDVSSFRTDHGAKDWRVLLNPPGVEDGEEATTAAIVQANIPPDASTRSGTWEYQFLAPYGDSLAENDSGDNQPIAAVGRFDARIENVRHIVGAFGAHRTTAPYTP